MARVYSILFWLFFALSCALWFVGALCLWLLTALFDPQRRLNHYYSCLWGSCYVRVYPGWTYRVTGRNNIDRSKAYVLVANHTSLADIVLLFGVFRQFKWVSKESVFKVPFLGWNMRLCRYIPLVRGERGSILRMMKTCHGWLTQGMSVIMFPEGTRSPDGRVRRFRHGAFSMAMDAKVDVVPIAIHGGHQIIPKHRGTFSTQANLWVEVLEPVSLEGFADAESLAEAVRQRIKDALDQNEPGQPMAEAV